jgi:hypothetical protein
MSPPHVPDDAQNSNPGSIWDYFIFDRIQVTGLNKAFLIIFSAIAGLWDWFAEQRILRGEKPAFVFPFGGRISAQVEHIMSHKKGWGKK